MVRVPTKTITAVFFKTASGNEPVRDWLLKQDRADRKTIGEDIKTCEFWLADRDARLSFHGKRIV